MAVDLGAEVRRVKIADALTNGDLETDPDSDPSTDEPETTGSGKEAPVESASAAQQGPAVQTFADYTAAPVPADQTPVARSQPVSNVPRGIYTGPEEEGGQRYVIDQDTGQKVPYAELATAADKAAQPPSGIVLPQVDVTGKPEVRRAQLVDPDPDTAYLQGVGDTAGPEVRRAYQAGVVPKADLIDPDPDQAYLQGAQEAATAAPEVRSRPSGRAQVEGMPPGPLVPATEKAPGLGPVQTLSDYSGGTYRPQQTTQQPAAAQQGGDTGVADFFAKRGDKPIASANDSRLATVTAGDQNYRVNKEAAPYFQGFLNELAAKGAPIQAGDSWVYREKVGAKGISDHAYGGAIDVNQGSLDRNKVSPAFQKWIDANPGTLQQIEKHWNIYGGERFGDLGHFEWGGAPFKQAAQQSAAQQSRAAVSEEPAITNSARTGSYTLYSGEGQRPIKNIILHSSDGTEKGDTNTLTGNDPAHNASVHYYVTEDGRAKHFVSDNDIAYHAGDNIDPSQYSNAVTIGIEQEHIDGQPWKDTQVRASAQLAADILGRHPELSIDNLLGHSDIAPERKQDPLNYPWAKFRAYVAQAQGQEQGGTREVAAPSAQPVTKLKTGFYQDEKPTDFLTGRVTTFATPDDIASGQDNGVGAPRLGKLDTTQVAGVAVPQWVLEQQFGNSTAAMRQARVDVVDPQTGKRLRVPIVDIGPGGGPENAGVVADMTPALSNYFGGDKNLSIRIVPGVGPDVIKNPQLFADEQAAIKNGFDSSTLDAKRQVIGPQGPQFATRAQTPEEAAQAQKTVQAAIQKQQAALAKLPEYGGENAVGLYKRLDDPVDGVSDPMRRAYQTQVKAEITRYAQDFYGIKDPAQAFAKATSDANFGTVTGEVARKIGPYFNQAVTAFNQSAVVLDQNRLDELAKAVHPEASPEARKTFINSITSESDPAARAAHINAIIGQLAQENPNNPALAGLRATDIADSADRLANPEYQKRQREEIDRQVAQNMRDLRPDPRLKGTAAEWWADQLAQLPKNVIEGVTGPIGDSLMVSEIYQGTMERLRQENPGMSEDELKAKIGGSSATQVIAIMTLNRLSGGKLGTLVGEIENPAARIGASALMHVGAGGTIGAAQQIATNIAEGKQPFEGVGAAAGAGAIQAAPGAILSGLHGGPVHPEEPVPETRPAVTVPPVEPPLRPVTHAEVTGPEVSAPTVPWYKGGPLISRGTERTTFTPAELAERAATLKGRTPEELQAAAEGLTPPTDFTRRSLFLDSSEAQQADIQRAQAAQAPQPTPEQQAKVDRVNVVRGATGAGAVGAEEPWVSKIANRFTAERMASGEIGPVEPGTGVSKEEMLARGLRMGPEQVTQHISNLMNNVGGDPKLQAAAVRAEEARLTQRSHDLSLVSEANPNNSQARLDADNAFKDLSDFHNGPVAKLKNNWHAQGISLQGEIPADLSTYNGLREQFLKDVGKAPSPEMEPAMRKAAKQVRDVTAAETAALNNLGAEIERQSGRRRLPSDEEVRMNIMKRMGVEPCPT